MTIVNKKKYVAIASLLLVGIGTTTVFQNCSKANFAANEDSLSLASSGGLTTYAQTTLNTPVAFALKHEDELKGVSISFKMTEAHGTLDVLDANAAKIQFTPEVGFRGRQEATVTIKDRYGSSFDLVAVIDVGNGLSAIEPALAVRATGCLNCHSQVASNMITDFGFNGDGKGRDYFFGGGDKPWNGNIYGAHGGGYSDFVLNPARTVYVPAAALPTRVLSGLPDGQKEGVQTLADYVRKQFSLSPDAGTKGVNVQEAQSIYIGAPTASLIDKVMRLGNARLKYFKNEQSSPGLAGLSDRGSYFRNAGTLVCDGDVAVRGPLLLDNLVVDTKNGCRLYVIGTVFIEGTIRYANANPNRNVQITSSRMISMGLGKTRLNGVDCAPGSQYADGANGAAPEYPGYDSYENRASNFPNHYVFVTRETGDTNKIGADAMADYRAINEPILDASCRTEGRAVAFDRVLLNAPMVQSRYTGNVDGTIIAEVALMALGNFKFTFDDVFNNVPVLPFFDKSVYLDVR